jgi:hypothetical protein
MDVFALDDHLLSQYAGFARSLTRIRAIEIQNKVNALYAGRRFWPEPLIQLNPHYEGGGSIQALVGPGAGRGLRTNLPRSRPVQDDLTRVLSCAAIKSRRLAWRWSSLWARRDGIHPCACLIA